MTVHGWIKEHKKNFIGPANWEIIRKIKQTVKIPVFANGGIRTIKDFQECLELTGVDGVMTSEAILENAAFFHDVPVHLEDQCLMYLDLAKEWDEKMCYVKQHAFKFLHSALTAHPDFRKDIGEAREIDTVIEVTKKIKELWKDIAPEDKITWYQRYWKNWKTESGHTVEKYDDFIEVMNKKMEEIKAS